MGHKAYHTRIVRRVQGSANLKELVTGNSLFHRSFACNPLVYVITVQIVLAKGKNECLRKQTDIFSKELKNYMSRECTLGSRAGSRSLVICSSFNYDACELEHD